MTAMLAMLFTGVAAANVQLTCVDEAAHGYATFQSHNQKVAANQRGIFMTHIRTRNEDYTAQQWRLLRSTDGGETFEIIHEDTHATNPPVLETDAAGNLYLIRVDFVDNNAYLYRFRAKERYKDPAITTIPGGAAGKYAAYFDEPGQRLFFFSHNNTFHVIGLDGTVQKSFNLLQPGESAVLQYPLLTMDAHRALYAAWTTQKHGEYLYWDIHCLKSPNGGVSWTALDGSLAQPPVVADQHGPATRISLDDEYESHTWLSSVMAKGGKLHVLYLAQTDPPRQHYMRYDTASGEREIDQSPAFGGGDYAIQSLSGFFATASDDRMSPLYCVGARDGRVVCLVSHDNGATWQDHARSDETFHVYSLGGCRRLHDGAVIGSFTDQGGSNLVPGQDSKVYFFKIDG
jgi:hypothetical protein